MKSLKNTLSKSLRNRKISPPHWQKTFFDHVLRNSESYADKWEYVSENPVRAGWSNVPKIGRSKGRSSCWIINPGTAVIDRRYNYFSAAEV